MTWSTGVPLCLAAAEHLAGDGVDVEVVDLRWLNPLDIDTVIASIGKTRRAAVVHEANLTGGLGGEIVARVTEALFGTLRAPILRVAMPDVPMPAAPSLQAVALPNVASVASTVRRLLERSEVSL